MKIKRIEKIALINGILLDGTEHMVPKANQVILVDKDTIIDVISKEEYDKNPGDYLPCDMQGKYILPGLINMHVHLAGNGKPQKKQRDNEALVKKIMSTALTRAVAKKLVAKFAEIELMSGVTTIRTVGGLGSFDTQIRDEIISGKRIGPRILAANEGISVPKGHMAGSVAISATTIDEALRHVEKAHQENVDLIKLMITGGVMDAKAKGVPGEVKMQAEMIKAVCDKAHSLGYVVAAHVESTEGVRIALANGVDSIEHGAKPDQEIIELFKKNNAFVCTTISPALPYALFDRSISHASEVEQYNGNVVFEGIIECCKMALKENIPVALGNDVGCPYITQYDFWRELVYFQKYCGVSSTYALHCATLGNAKLAGIQHLTGSIEKGKMADLIVTKENPIDDLCSLRHVDTVIRLGKMICNPKIKRNSKVDFELDKFLN